MSKRTLPFLAVSLALTALGADWPQWRGPERNNISRETGLLKTWPPGGPKLVGTYSEAGTGYSGVAVVGDRLYSMGADDSKEYVFAVDLKTMKKAWSTEVGPRFSNSWGDGPRATPTVDGELIYVLGGQGNLLCVKAAGGDKVWSKNMQRDLGGQMMSGWGYSESVLVNGDHLVCTPGGKKGAVAALNKKTGDPIWQSVEFTDPAGYSSLVPAEIDKVRQYVQMTGQSVAGVAAKDGKLLWRMPKAARTAAIPTPVVSGNLVYATSGYGSGCALFRTEADGKGFKAAQVYANQNMGNQHGGVVLLDGHVYGFSDGKGWVCQDFMTGSIVWQERQKLGKGSVTCADGLLYCYAERDGTAALVEATVKGYTEKGRFTIPNRTQQPFPRSKKGGDNVWTHPVVAGGKLFLRDQELIFVYDVRGSAAP
jgi:outer membrane protein assembly factor BamB